MSATIQLEQDQQVVITEEANEQLRDALRPNMPVGSIGVIAPSSDDHWWIIVGPWATRLPESEVLAMRQAYLDLVSQT